MTTAPNPFSALLDFLDRLKAARIHFDLGYHTLRAVMVQIAVPGARWEVEFLEDGDVRVEVFASRGDVERVDSPDELLRRLGA